MSLIFTVLLSIAAAADANAPAEKPREKVYEKAISAFEEQDRKTPPQDGGILFVGSSTIRMWNLEKSFPELHPLNRGFGGSQYSDVAEYADRVITPYHPKTIVLYAGDNDIAHGKSPEQTFADFQAVIAAIHRSLKDVRVFVLSIKPSVARWQMYGKMQQVNRMMADFAEKDPQVDYVELGPPLLDSNGKPRPELFEKDGLHLNSDGYAIWTKILTPMLSQKP